MFGVFQGHVNPRKNPNMLLFGSARILSSKCNPVTSFERGIDLCSWHALALSAKNLVLCRTRSTRMCATFASSQPNLNTLIANKCDTHICSCKSASGYLNAGVTLSTQAWRRAIPSVSESRILTIRRKLTACNRSQCAN